MAFSALAESTETLTEELRSGSPSTDITPLYEKTKEAYELTVQSIKELIDSQG